MGDEELEKKSQIVREICSIATLFTSCYHIRSPTRKIGFIDWYLILKVDEDSGIDVIRRRYRQLALQIHPDKNGHPKAEVAFQLLLEGYECLSDKTRRKTFNSERKINYCKECHQKSQHFMNPQKIHKDAQHAKQYKILRAFRQVQNRLKEECRVIENCLRVNEPKGAESPLFDPSDGRLPDYPHCKDWGYFGNFACESPVYQIREERCSWRKTPGFRF